MGKDSRLGTGKKVYQFDRRGILIKSYMNVASAMVGLNKSEALIYQAVKKKALVSDKYYLSYYHTFDVEALGLIVKKSKELCKHTIDDFTIINNYSANLLITLQKEYHKLPPQDIQKILTELINCQVYATK